jgi:two-component system sensor kinase FixL
VTATIYSRGGRGRTLAAVAGLAAIIGSADWALGNRASLGVFYILPMVVGASVLPAAGIILLALGCSTLRSLFDIPTPYLEQLLRFIFATAAYASVGFLIASLNKNRELAVANLENVRREQELRIRAEEQLRNLVESSPAAILTLDKSGTVIAANRATDTLLMLPPGQTVLGRNMGGFLPVLADALQYDPGPEGLRTAAECQGQRANGEVFLASTWFSTYFFDKELRLAAIVVDSSEEMRDREEENLRQLKEGNRITAAAVFHEVRNFSGAISVGLANLRDKHSPDDEDFKALTSLAAGLEKVATLELKARASEALEEVDLHEVLDDLRIVIEEDWREAAGTVHWNLLSRGPDVLAERHGLLQAFLNISHNALRAVQESPEKTLSVQVSVEEQRAMVRFTDSGSGVSHPERLFAPFQAEAYGTGLGLYVSRAVVRSYGGELRFEPSARGTCFAVELQMMV